MSVSKLIKCVNGDASVSVQDMLKKDSSGFLLAKFFHKVVLGANLYKKPEVKKVTDLAFPALEAKEKEKKLSTQALQLFQNAKARYQTLLLIYRQPEVKSCIKKEKKVRQTRQARSQNKKSVQFNDDVKTVQVDRYLPLSPYAKIDREFKAMMELKKMQAEKQK